MYANFSNSIFMPILARFCFARLCSLFGRYYYRTMMKVCSPTKLTGHKIAVNILPVSKHSIIHITEWVYLKKLHLRYWIKSWRLFEARTQYIVIYIQAIPNFARASGQERERENRKNCHNVIDFGGVRLIATDHRTHGTQFNELNNYDKMHTHTQTQAHTIEHDVSHAYLNQYRKTNECQHPIGFSGTRDAKT